MTFNYLKKETKKLIGMSSIILGSFLILEHIYTYGGIDLLDILGHEWLGIIFILIGILVANRWNNMKLNETIPYAKKKLKFIFSK